MEAMQMHGVVETVPEFSYTSYRSDGSVRRVYDGHERIVAAFMSKCEADDYEQMKRQRAVQKSHSGYVAVHELEYKLTTLAKYEVVLSDVMPSVPSRKSL